MLVVQVHDQAQGNEIVLKVIQERPAGGTVLTERPSGTVNDKTGFVFYGVDLPEFFQADTVMLG